MKNILFILLFVSFSVNASALFNIIDKSLDKLDPTAPYSKLKRKTWKGLNKNFVADGCSGEISKVWNEYIYPRYIKSKLDGPEGVAVPFPVEYCCMEHDEDYYNAGISKSSWFTTGASLKRQRKRIDERFRACIKNPENKQKFVESLALVCLEKDASKDEVDEKYRKLDKKINVSKIADLMYFGVRFGGRPCSNHQYRFGYGYENCEGAGKSTLNTSFKVILDMFDSWF